MTKVHVVQRKQGFASKGEDVGDATSAVVAYSFTWKQCCRPGFSLVSSDSLRRRCKQAATQVKESRGLEHMRCGDFSVAGVWVAVEDFSV